MALDERTAMEPSPAAAVTRFLIRFGRPLLRRRPAGGASAHFQIRIGNQPVLAPLAPGRASAGPGGAVRLTGQPRPGTLRAGLVDQTPAGT